jgi:hypothetical protein
MNTNSAELPVLQTPLDAILRSELEFGNEIAEIQLGGWSEVDLIVSLKFPFRKDYKEEFKDAEFYRNTDTHYSLTDSYTANREAVEAPY